MKYKNAGLGGYIYILAESKVGKWVGMFRYTTADEKGVPTPRSGRADALAQFADTHSGYTPIAIVGPYGADVLKAITVTPPTPPEPKYTVGEDWHVTDG